MPDLDIAPDAIVIGDAWAQWLAPVGGAPTAFARASLVLLAQLVLDRLAMLEAARRSAGGAPSYPVTPTTDVVRRCIREDAKRITRAVAAPGGPVGRAAIDRNLNAAVEDQVQRASCSWHLPLAAIPAATWWRDIYRAARLCAGAGGESSPRRGAAQDRTGTRRLLLVEKLGRLAATLPPAQPAPPPEVMARVVACKQEPIGPREEVLGTILPLLIALPCLEEHFEFWDLEAPEVEAPEGRRLAAWEMLYLFGALSFPEIVERLAKLGFEHRGRRMVLADVEALHRWLLRILEAWEAFRLPTAADVSAFVDEETAGSEILRQLLEGPVGGYVVPCKLVTDPDTPPIGNSRFLAIRFRGHEPPERARPVPGVPAGKHLALVLNLIGYRNANGGPITAYAVEKWLSNLRQRIASEARRLTGLIVPTQWLLVTESRIPHPEEQAARSGGDKAARTKKTRKKAKQEPEKDPEDPEEKEKKEKKEARRKRQRREKMYRPGRLLDWIAAVTARDRDGFRKRFCRLPRLLKRSVELDRKRCPELAGLGHTELDVMVLGWRLALRIASGSDLGLDLDWRHECELPFRAHRRLLLGQRVVAGADAIEMDAAIRKLDAIYLEHSGAFGIGQFGL